MKKKLIALMMVLAMLVCMMSGAVFAADSPEMTGVFGNADGKVVLEIQVSGDVTELAFSVKMTDEAVKAGSMSYDFSEEFLDFVAQNKGISECGVPFDETDRVVFGCSFSETTTFEGKIATVAVDVADLTQETEFVLYNGDTEVGSYEYYEAPVTYGDVTGDGVADAGDSLEILKSVVGLSSLDEMQKVAADVTADGIVDANDSLEILKKVVGLVDAFKVEK